MNYEKAAGWIDNNACYNLDICDDGTCKENQCGIFKAFNVLKAMPEYEKLKERDRAKAMKDKHDFSGFYIGECPSCGTGIDSNSNFCFNCGQRLDRTEESS